MDATNQKHHVFHQVPLSHWGTDRHSKSSKMTRHSESSKMSLPHLPSGSLTSEDPIATSECSQKGMKRGSAGSWNAEYTPPQDISRLSLDPKDFCHSCLSFLKSWECWRTLLRIFHAMNPPPRASSWACLTTASYKLSRNAVFWPLLRNQNTIRVRTSCWLGSCGKSAVPHDRSSANTRLGACHTQCVRCLCSLQASWVSQGLPTNENLLWKYECSFSSKLGRSYYHVLASLHWAQPPFKLWFLCAELESICLTLSIQMGSILVEQLEWLSNLDVVFHLVGTTPQKDHHTHVPIK